MCGIIGSINSGNDDEVVLKGLEIMKNRGPNHNCLRPILVDKNGKETVEGYLGHNLLAIVGHVIQPLESNKSMLSANCEIYNWKELNLKYNLQAKNDADLLLKLLDMKGIEALEELDGVYAFAYQQNEKITLGRDIIGVKPLFYSGKSINSEKDIITEFVFGSEKKAIGKNSQELNPREILTYNIISKKITFEKRKFFELKNKEELDEKKLKQLIINAVKKRLPPKEDKIKIGVLFSGGIDSTLIAKIIKDLGYDLTCYSAGFQDEGTKKPDDLEVAERVAKDMDFNLKIKSIKLEDTEKYLKQIIPIIEEADVVKAGVALPFAVCCEEAKKNNVKIIFSGLGSEEIFAGYQRHKERVINQEKNTNIKTIGKAINEECIQGLEVMHQRDLYRDDVITMNYGIELRLPLLDIELTKYALGIPGEEKIINGVEKAILRKISKEIGVVDYVCERKKKAAQYGSRFDSAMKKLAHKKGFETRKEYLKQFLNESEIKY